MCSIKVRTVFAVLIMATLVHGVAFGESPRGAGIVTTLQGEALVTRAIGSTHQAMPMKFRDEVFFKDQISVKEDSLARVLLGGKALVTVRELSDLTINESPNKPTVLDMLSGKISLAVAKMRMRPGEAIEVRTPNAVAAVRGTTVIVEVVPGPESIGSGKPGDMVTNVHVLSGKVDVFSLSSPNAPPVSVGPGFSVSVSGALMGPLRPNPPLPQITKGLEHTVHHTETPDGTKNALVSKEMVKAMALSDSLAPKRPAGQGERDANAKGPETLKDAKGPPSVESRPDMMNGLPPSGQPLPFDPKVVDTKMSGVLSDLKVSPNTALPPPTFIVPPTTMLMPPPTTMYVPPPTMLPPPRPTIPTTTLR